VKIEMRRATSLHLTPSNSLTSLTSFKKKSKFQIKIYIFLQYIIHKFVRNGCETSVNYKKIIVKQFIFVVYKF